MFCRSVGSARDLGQPSSETSILSRRTLHLGNPKLQVQVRQSFPTQQFISQLSLFTMASLLRTFSLPTRLLFSARASSIFSQPAITSTPSTWMRSAIPSMVKAGEQTRGMKVQSSVKKRCEHCKVRSIELRAWREEWRRHQHSREIARTNIYLFFYQLGCTKEGRKETYRPPIRDLQSEPET